MPARSFVHLHLHTHYSLLDGATRIRPLIERAKQLQMPAVAITDHGNLFGAIEFYAAARKAGIQPIIGMEAYLAPGDRRAREGSDRKEYFHLLLLAMNLPGYRNLMRLATIGYAEGFYRKPRIDKDVLREYSDGLICTSTCLAGEIPQILLHQDRAAAEEMAKTYLTIFGPDRFFVELQDHGIEEQRMLNPELADLAKRLGVATIATNDVHYLDQEDVEAHDALCCINTGARLDEEDRFRFPSGEFYFKSGEQMAALFSEYPEAIENTLHVARQCALELDLTRRYAPVFKVPDDITDTSGRPLDDAAYLRRLVGEGARDRYQEFTPELRERIDYELEVITSKGFASYFLIVWDCVRYARRHGIPVGARGSGCSSVVAHCLRISAPDPIRYGLYFERFMDPDRDEMPDIDLDICQNGRAQLLEYVREKYGHVAQIITFGTLKAKAVIKDVARVMGLGFEEANNLTKLVPATLNITLDMALAQEPALRERYESDETVRKVVDIGRRLEGVARNSGVHAAGIVVADQPLVNFLPLCKASGSDAVVTQFDGPTVERVGLLKMDFLGLRTLTTLERARQLAERTTGDSIELDRIALDDPKVYALFARGDTKGIFQFESGGMRDVVMRMKPNRIEDLIAANALFRPGPMEYISDYIARKHGTTWTTPHPNMTEVLSETYGIMVYQEQVSRIVNRLGNIELKAAFRLAKSISKKNTAMIESMRAPFLKGCGDNGVSERVATEVFEDILKFGGYAFNKAHSTGYALIAYQTAWMKAYHPDEFMAAVMTFEMGSTEKVAQYVEECKEMGITVEPPSVNASEYEFHVQPVGADSSDRPNQHAIRFGLGAIKGVGAKASAAIAQERECAGPFPSLFDFCERVDLSAVNRSTIEALICAGAFDETGGMRKALIDSLDRAISGGQGVQQDRKAGQMGLFDLDDGDDACASAAPIGTELSAAEWGEAEMLAREKAVLGFYITRHPLASHECLLDACTTASTVDLARFKDSDVVIVGGMVSSLRTLTARGGRKPGRRLGIVTLEDLRGRVEAILFPDDLMKYRDVLVPDAIVFLEGAVDRKREEPSLRIRRVVTHAQAVEAFAKALILTVRDGDPVDEIVQLLRHAKDGAAGSSGARVYLNVETADRLIAQIHGHPSLRVFCSPSLTGALVNLLGADCVCVLGPKRSVIPIAKATIGATAKQPGAGAEPRAPASHADLLPLS